LILALAAAAMVTAGAGCATSKDLERVEREVSSVSSEVGTVKGGVGDLDISIKAEAKKTRDILAALKDLQDSQAQLTEAMKGLNSDLATVKRNQADLGSRMFTMAGGEITGFSGKLDEVRHGLETTNAKLDDMKAALLQRIAALEEVASKPAPAQGGGTAGTPEVAGEPAKDVQGADTGKPAEKPSSYMISDPTKLYQGAYLDYTKGNYDVAIAELREYLKAFPDGEFTGNAQYWIGESLYSLGKYDEAGAEFDKVVQKYPDSPKVAGAILKQGFCFDALNKPAEAKAAYELVMKKYPDSEAAKLASEKLKPKSRGKVPGK